MKDRRTLIEAIVCALALLILLGLAGRVQAEEAPPLPRSTPIPEAGYAYCYPEANICIVRMNEHAATQKLMGLARQLIVAQRDELAEMKASCAPAKPKLPLIVPEPTEGGRS